MIMSIDLTTIRRTNRSSSVLMFTVSGPMTTPLASGNTTQGRYDERCSHSMQRRELRNAQFDTAA